MMGDYWIKLYHEVIDDPKMATLPDRLWRRFVELCLLAGRLCPDKSGKLPDTRQLAWLLRMDTDELQMDIDQLSAINLVQAIPNGWLIVNFYKRQEPPTSTERSRAYRQRKQKEQYYCNEDATQMQRNVAQINRLTETETEAELSAAATSFEPRAIKIFAEVTSFTAIPGRNAVDDTHKLRSLITQHGDKTTDYLKPFWNEWLRRKYSKANTGWLDWALTGEIPKWKQEQEAQIDPRTLATEVY